MNTRLKSIVKFMRYVDAYIDIWDTDKYMMALDAMADAYEGPRNVALDLGAHVGTRSIWLATDGGFKRVYAVEMEPRNFQLLCGNVYKNNLQDIIIPILAAISDRHELCSVYFGTANKGQYSICYDSEIKPRTGKIMSTPLSKLLDVIGADEINFMKMDIEGAEYKIFAYPDRAMLHDVRFLFLERHGPNHDFFSDKFFSNMDYDPKDPQKKLFESLRYCGFEDIKENKIGQLMIYNKNFLG